MQKNDFRLGELTPLVAVEWRRRAADSAARSRREALLRRFSPGEEDVEGDEVLDLSTSVRFPARRQRPDSQLLPSVPAVAIVKSVPTLKEVIQVPSAFVEIPNGFGPGQWLVVPRPAGTACILLAQNGNVEVSGPRGRLSSGCSNAIRKCCLWGVWSDGNFTILDALSWGDVSLYGLPAIRRLGFLKARFEEHGAGMMHLYAGATAELGFWVPASASAINLCDEICSGWMPRGSADGLLFMHCESQYEAGLNQDLKHFRSPFNCSFPLPTERLQDESGSFPIKESMEVKLWVPAGSLVAETSEGASFLSLGGDPDDVDRVVALELIRFAVSKTLEVGEPYLQNVEFKILKTFRQVRSRKQGRTLTKDLDADSLGKFVQRGILRAWIVHGEVPETSTRERLALIAGEGEAHNEASLLLD